MKKNWPGVALAIILIAIIGVSCFAFQRPPGWDGMFAWPNGVTALGILLTLFFIAWQALLTRQSITSSDVASKAELRAYVGVLINSANYQERDKSTKFAGVPVLSNTGKTPAHAVRYRVNAAILVEPLIPNYVFPPGQNEIGEYVLGINTPMTMIADVADYCDAGDADDILHGRGNRALYCWGTVLYKDVFKDDHETTFCHRLFFYPNPDEADKWLVRGNYLAGKNNAT